MNIPTIRAQNTRLFFDPGSVQAGAVDEVVTLTLKVDTAQPVYSWRIVLTWDPETLDFQSSAEGSFLKDTGQTIFVQKQENPAGTIPEVACVSFNTAGKSGAGTLATFQFKVLKETAGTEVALSQTFLIKKEAGADVQVAHEASGATVTLVTAGALVAHAGSDVAVDEGVSVSFDGGLSQGTGLTYKWSFTDGGVAKTLSGVAPSYVFNLPGVYTVTLEVSDGVDESSDTVKVTVRDKTPPVPMVAVTGVDEANHADVGDLIEFDATGSSDPDGGSIATYHWNLGDGATLSGLKVSHAYSANGTYQVTLTVYDVRNNNPASKIITVVIGDGINDGGAQPTGDTLLDVYTQKDPNDGKGKDKAGDSYDPYEEVILYCLVQYEGRPVQNAFVSFYITGPQSDTPIVVLRSDQTDINGLAELGFRIPAHQDNSDNVLGTWKVRATSYVLCVPVQDTLTFEVKWEVAILNVGTFNIDGEEREEFSRYEDVTIEATLHNYGKNKNTVGVSYIVEDSNSVILNKTEIKKLEIAGGTDKETSLTLRLGKEYPKGKIKVTISATPSFYEEHDIQGGSHKDTIFTVIDHILAIYDTYVSESVALEGEMVELSCYAMNLGTETESFELRVSTELNTLYTEILSLRPSEFKKIAFNWNTTGMRDDNYTLLLSVEGYMKINHEILEPDLRLPGKTYLAPEGLPQKYYLNTDAGGTLTLGELELRYPSVFQEIITNLSLITIIGGTTILSLLITIIRRARP
jgi:PKD repeat protein